MASDEGEVQVLHSAVPGRVRLLVPPLKRDRDLALQVESVAATWRGVRRAAASAVTGSLLLEYDPKTTDVQSLAAAAQAEVSRVASAGRIGRSLAGMPAGLRRGENGALPELMPARGGRDAAQARHPGKIRQASSVSGSDRSPAVSLPAPVRRRARAAEAALGGLALVAAGAALTAVRTHGHNLALDQAPLALAEQIHNPALTAVMRGASRLVELPVLVPVTFASALLGVGRRRAGDVPWLAPASVFGGSVVVAALKTVLRRARPVAFEHLAPARGYSLPSGHAFLAVCLYGLLAHHGLRWLRARRPEDRRAAGILLVAAATAVLLVGASRVYLGVHYPSDVIAGYALALLWLFFLAALNDWPRETN